MKLTLLPLEKDDVIRIRCEGDITLHNLMKQDDPLQNLLGPHCFAHKVLLNMEGTQGVDTTGIGWLVEEYRKFARSSGKLVLCGVPATVAQVLDFLRLGTFLEIAADETGARELLREQPHNQAPETNHRSEEPHDRNASGRLSS